MSILLLNKEKDMTSFSAVKQAQKELGFKKAGHGGTLDPLATGVLPIFFEQSTKFLQFFNSETKEYIADFIFGIRTVSYTQLKLTTKTHVYISGGGLAF